MNKELFNKLLDEMPKFESPVFHYPYSAEDFHDADGRIFTRTMLPQSGSDELKAFWHIARDRALTVEDCWVRIYNEDKTIDCYVAMRLVVRGLAMGMPLVPNIVRDFENIIHQVKQFFEIRHLPEPIIAWEKTGTDWTAVQSNKLLGGFVQMNGKGYAIVPVVTCGVKVVGDDDYPVDSNQPNPEVVITQDSIDRRITPEGQDLLSGAKITDMIGGRGISVHIDPE